MIRDGEVMLCARRTTSGHPCRQRLNPGDAACRLHVDQLTECDIAYAEGYWSGWRNGLGRGREQGSVVYEDAVGLRVEAELAKRPCEHYKLIDHQGRQIIDANGFAYAWAGDGQLAVGDLVWIPGTQWREATTMAVSRLGSDYAGALTILSRRG